LAFCVIVVAIFGSAVLVSHVMIELAGACGELARNDDAVTGIESSNRSLAGAMLAISRGESSGPTGCRVHSSALRRFR